MTDTPEALCFEGHLVINNDKGDPVGHFRWNAVVKATGIVQLAQQVYEMKHLLDYDRDHGYESSDDMLYEDHRNEKGVLGATHAYLHLHLEAAIEEREQVLAFLIEEAKRVCPKWELPTAKS